MYTTVSSKNENEKKKELLIFRCLKNEIYD